jgi:hypothetical protein
MSTDSTKAAAGIDKLVASLEPYFTTKAPFQLPQHVRDTIVEYAWIVTLVLGLLLLPGVFALLTALGFAGALAAAVGVVVGPMYWIAGLALIIQIGFLFASVPGLKAKSYAKGWKVVFYSELFSAAYSVLQLNVVSWIGGAIGLVIGLFLFQVKKGFH